MDKVEKWCLMICAVSVFSGILISVIPDGRIKNAFRVLTSLILLYSILSPLFGISAGDIDFEGVFRTQQEKEEELRSYSAEAAAEAAGKAISETIVKKCAERGLIITCETVCEITESAAEIKIVTVYSADTDAKKEILRKICGELEISDQVLRFVGDEDEQR
ncbi:MAG: hypothetical protein ACI4GB_00120 [Acutalibacteraceae bacterium]